MSEAIAKRLRAAQFALGERDAALLAGPGADLRYLTGYNAHPSERLTLLVLPPLGRPALVAPRLEAMAAATSPAVRSGLVELLPWDETEDPYPLTAAQLARPDHPRRVLVDATLWARHVLGLQAALPGRAFGLASEVTRELRIVKDDEEIELLRRAARAADRVVARIAAGRLVGRTEGDVSHEVRRLLVDEGHDEATFAIVASGPASASPHHQPDARVIGPGEPIVLDIGGTIDGYGSDITRTLWVSGASPAVEPDPDFVAAHDLVRDAQAAATRAVRPGITGERLDAIARERIAAGGHGPAFLHRLGHGIGLDGHEDPYLVAGNAEPLRAGMAFSIEPGVYHDGRFGVRIEDIVVCGPGGPIVLNEASRDLVVVAG